MPTYRCYPVIRFYKTVLAELTALNAQELGISNLSGLEHATNLERLDLSGNRITDVSLLAGLTHLRVLNLQDNEIRDISLLSGLKNLTQLNLKGNAIVDISPLTDLPALAVPESSRQSDPRYIGPCVPEKPRTRELQNLGWHGPWRDCQCPVRGSD